MILFVKPSGRKNTPVKKASRETSFLEKTSPKTCREMFRESFRETFREKFRETFRETLREPCREKNPRENNIP